MNMGYIWLLFYPRYMGAKNRFKFGSGSRKRFILVCGISLLILVSVFVMSVRVLFHFKTVPILGDYLAKQMLAMCLITFFGLIMFSAVNTALSNLYLARDLEILHSSPVPLSSIFISKLLHSIIDSSWMVILFGIPIFSAYGYIYRPGAFFYFHLFHSVISVILIAGLSGAIVTMLVVYALPARRARDVILLLGIFLLVVLYLVFRAMRPEQLVNPDVFMDMAEYLSALSTQRGAFLPTTWAMDVIWCQIEPCGRGIALPTAILYDTLLLLLVISLIMAQRIYRSGFFKSQEGRARSFRGRMVLEFMSSILTRPFPRDMRVILEKDIRVFFRDNTQWTQLLLLGALVFVYLYNFSVLPLDKTPIRADYLQGILAFLNLGLAGFVISALCARFVYPAVSIEGEGFWIVKSSPVKIERFLIAKFLFYGGILFFLSEILIVVSNVLLDVDKIMMYLTTTTMFVLSFGLTGLAIGFGARYPQFKYENIASVSTGFGAFSYMIMSGGLILVSVIIQAGPLYQFFIRRSRAENIPLAEVLYIILSVITVGIICAIAAILYMKKGINTLKAIESF